MVYTAIILTGLISYYISSIFNKGVYLFLLFFSFVVLNIEVLSLFKRIDNVNILILTLIEFLICHFIWIKKGRPLLKVDIKGFLLNLKKAYKEDKTLILLTAAWVIFISGAFILSVFMPVTEADAQGYHALRTLFWLKDGFISHFETADVRNICMPYNSETFYTWILALTNKDAGFSLLQFFSYFLLIFSGYKIMEIYGIDFNKRIWAILIFSSLPAVMIQTSSTQTDLCIGALILCSIYLILEYKKERLNSLLFFSALATALSFGTKTTGFMASIPVIIWFIFILKKDFYKFFLFLCLNSIIFASYAYILNMMEFNNPFSSHAFILYNKKYGGIKTFIAIFIKYTVQFFDFTGLNLGKFLNDYIINSRNFILDTLKIPPNLGEIDSQNAVNIYINEQTSGFGILGLIVFLPVSIIGFFKKDLKIFSIIFWTQFLILCSTMLYTAFGVRYLVAFVSIALPLLSLSYTNKMNVLKFIFTIYAIFFMGYVSLFLPSRPLVYLSGIFMQNGNTEEIQNKARDLKYKFFGPVLLTEIAAYKNSVEPYCKNNNKIAMFAAPSALIYGAKYLELNNNCTVETLNMPHIEQYDLNKYSALIFEENKVQFTNTLNKNDLKNPIINSDKIGCVYAISDRAPKNFRGLEKAIYAKCKINENYIKKLGFKKTDKFEYIIEAANGIKKQKTEVWTK